MKEPIKSQSIVHLDARRQNPMPSLQEWLPQRIAALKSECQPDSTGNYRLTTVLPQSKMLSASERAVVEERVGYLAEWLDLGRPITLDGRTLDNDQAISVMIAKLLIPPRGSKLDETSSGALAEEYLDALEDLSAWSVRNALRKWNRGESAKFDGKPHDFGWRPAPATLRRLAETELAPIKAEIMHLKMLLIAVPRLEFNDDHREKMFALLKELRNSLRAV
jgi:hypothetical protein